MMKQKNLIGVGSALVFLILSFGCGSGSSGDEVSVQDNESAYEVGLSAQTSAPNTKISKTVRPPNPSYTNTATFKFSCTTPPCTFKCKLDTNPWKKCKSPKTYTGLSDGAHTFKVQAIANGVKDKTPAKYSWTIYTSNYWLPVSATDAPYPSRQHTAVWTGTQMIIYGGIGSGDGGGKYDPMTDSWTTVRYFNEPTMGRYGHKAVWSGTEMIIWGGVAIQNGAYLKTGGRYNPATDSWTAIPISANTPSARYLHTMVWSGKEIIIWGGNDGSNALNSGGSYEPENDLWVQLPSTNAPSARQSHTAVWAGDRMIVWGGNSGLSLKNDGAAYDPVGYSWTTISSTNAPSARNAHSAVWTGTEMIIWGGSIFLGEVNDGAKYNPANDSWAAISSVNAPDARCGHTAIWTGNEMIIWGGYNTGPTTPLNTGGRYDPSTDSWAETSIINAPSPRRDHTAVWTGDRMIVWGGYNDYNDPDILGDGAVYFPE